MGGNDRRLGIEKEQSASQVHQISVVNLKNYNSLKPHCYLLSPLFKILNLGCRIGH